jgi:hypothetical protein
MRSNTVNDIGNLQNMMQGDPSRQLGRAGSLKLGGMGLSQSAMGVGQNGLGVGGKNLGRTKN